MADDTGDARDGAPVITEARYRALLQSVGAAVIATDAQGRVQLLNPAAAALTGWNAADARGRPLAGVFHTVDEKTRAPLESPAARILREGHLGVEHHALLIARNGTEWPIACSGAFIQGEDGELDGVVLVFRDRSADRASTRELEYSEERYRSLVQLAPDAMLVDRGGAVVLANAAAVRLFAADRSEQLLGRSALELFEPSYRETMGRRIAAVLAGQSVALVDARITRLNGKAVDVEVAASPSGGREQKAICIVLRDITLRKRSEEALRESKRQSVFQGELLWKAPVIAAFLDKELNIVWANKAYEEATGLSVQDMASKRCYAAWGRAVACRDCPVLSAMTSGELCEGEITPDPQDSGAEVSGCWLSRAAAVLDEDGNVLGAIVTAMDIRDRKRAEAATRAVVERSRRQQAVVATVAASPPLVAGDVSALARELTERAAKAAGVERVGVWLFDEDGEELRCVDLYQASAGSHVAGAVLRRPEYEHEFDALRTAKYVDADDPLTDPRTAGYVEKYLGPLRITSMLDAAIRAGGRNLGSLCFEHVDRPHHWEPDEIAFACQLADQVALAVLNQERQRAEEASRAGEAKYRELTENLNDVVYAANTEGTLTYISPPALMWSGYAPEEMVGRSLAEIVLAEDLPGVQHRFREVLEGRLAPWEYRYRTKDGQVRWARSSSRPIVEGGRVTGVRGVISDITDRKLAGLRLQTERDNLHALLAAAPAAIVVVDEREEVVHVNPAAERLFGGALAGDGRCAGDLIGCVHAKDDPRGCSFGASCADCALHDVVKEGLEGRAVRGREMEAEIRLDGRSERRSFVVNAEPLVLEGKRAAALAVQDITELRREQRERENLQVSMAQSDRLANMGMLAAGVAHEINNPLSSVVYDLEILNDDLPRLIEGMRKCHAELTALVGPEGAARALGDEHEAFTPAMLEDCVHRLREAASGASRIGDITRGLGTFSRVEQTELTPVNVQDTIERAVTLAHNEIKYRARLVKDLTRVPAVLASEGKLAQVFLNLVINAAHAIDEGQAERNEIRVRTFVRDDQVCIEVSDTGKGIAPEHQAKIFEPFFSTKGPGVGSGLGLTICKNIVTGFGGEITFTSEPGRGTRFLVQLPRLQGEGAKPAAAAPERQAPMLSSVSGRVLVVDDDAGIRASLAHMLGREHEVVTVSSGAEAKELLQRDRRFDLILCDLMMTRTSGMELHAWLLECDPGLGDRVVFITGGAFTPGAAQYLSTVRNPCVEKPLRPATIKALAAGLMFAARGKG